MLDEVDRKIVMLLQRDGRLSNAAIAEQVGLTTSAVYERVKKLERRGVIKGYVALADGEAVGKPIIAFVRLVIGTTADAYYRQSEQQFIETCMQEPDVLECHSVAGEDCYVLKVRAATPQSLEKLLRRLRADTPIARSTTSIVMSTHKEATQIAVGE